MSAKIADEALLSKKTKQFLEIIVDLRASGSGRHKISSDSSLVTVNKTTNIKKILPCSVSKNLVL